MMMGNKLIKTVQVSALVAVAGLGMIASANAGGNNVIGAVIGAGAGTVIGGELGGRNGAIIGAAVGAALGTVVATDHRHAQPVVVYPAPAPVYQPAPVYYPAPMYQPAPVYQPGPVFQAPPVFRGGQTYPPIVVAPGPVYRPPQTIVYAPPAIVVQPGWNYGHGHHGHHGRHGGYEQRFEGGYGHPNRY
jgi:hypothetical protein